MSDSPFIVTLDPANFQQAVIEGSARVPVLVDFWADWCQPCRILMPILAKLADEYQGRFILAKLDTEAHQALAAQFGIRSLPTVVLFRDGKPLDQFMGALPERDIRAFLDKHLPRESDNIVARAAQLLAEGDSDQALALLEQAAEQDPANPRIPLTRAQVLAQAGRHGEALQIIDQLPLDEAAKPEVAALRSKLQLSAGLEGAASVDELTARLAANEHDSEARFQLGLQAVAAGDHAAGMDQLLELMRRDRGYGDDAARKTLLQVFESLGDDPIVPTYRAKLSRLLY